MKKYFFILLTIFSYLLAHKSVNVYFYGINLSLPGTGLPKFLMIAATILFLYWMIDDIKLKKFNDDIQAILLQTQLDASYLDLDIYCM